MSSRRRSSRLARTASRAASCATTASSTRSSTRRAASRSCSDPSVPAGGGSAWPSRSVHFAGTSRVLPSSSTRISSSWRRRRIQPASSSERPSSGWRARTIRTVGGKPSRWAVCRVFFRRPFRGTSWFEAVEAVTDCRWVLLYVIHEGAGVVKGRLAVFDVGVRDWCGGHRGSAGVEGVSGLCPGLRCRVAGLGLSGQAPFPRSRGVPWRWVVALDAAGRVWHWFESWLGSRALVVGRRFADRVPAWEEARVISIWLRGADQSVVRCSGAQSSGRPSCLKGRRTPDRGASSPEHAPHAVVVSASLV